MNREFKAGYVAIVGEPNVGKSTLLNCLLKEKLSITSHKPQTTRQKVLGIYNNGDSQIVFLDTPGILKPKYLLHEEMIKHAITAIEDADVVVVIVDAGEKPRIPEEITETLKRLKTKKPILLVLNKIDTIKKVELEERTSQYLEYKMFEKIIPISALRNENIEMLLDEIKNYLPVGKPYYPTDIISSQPERFFVAEFIREKLFSQFKDEIPYACAVIIEQFNERDEGKTFISANIYVERESQKKIIIGKNGSALKRLGTEARIEIERFLQKEVYLELHVKVREKWRKNKFAIKQFGYKSEK